MVAQEEQDDFNAENSAAMAIGQRLEQARLAKGMSLADLSARLRVSERHLELIEQGQFLDLPARTYAIGFSRSYARIVGVDEAETVREVGDILDASEHDRPRRMGSTFEPGDPARVPSARLGWISAGAALLLIAGIFVFYRSFFSPAANLPPLQADAPPEPARSMAVQTAASPAGDMTGAVVFTALEDTVWVKFYDKTGRQLMQKQMAKGEIYTLPADADGPQIWTGRPDAFSITIGGRAVPKLAESEGVVKDVAVSAEALLGRSADKPSDEGTASPTA